jgi:hypothetical protein
VYERAWPVDKFVRLGIEREGSLLSPPSFVRPVRFELTLSGS